MSGRVTVLPPLPGSRGFTLIELVVVLAVLGIVAAYTVPRLADRGVFQARSFARELASSARFAAGKSRSSDCAIELRLDAVRFQLLQQSPAGGRCNAAAAYTILMQDSAGQAQLVPVPQGVAVGAALRWQFQPGGTVNVIGSDTAVINSFNVVVDAFTGRVSGP